MPFGDFILIMVFFALADLHKFAENVQAKGNMRKGGFQMEQLAFRTKLIFGDEPLAYLRNFKGKRIFLVCDPFMVKSNLVNKVIDALDSNEVMIFSEITPDPSIELVVQGVQRLQDFGPDVVIAFGGGSAIDAAKAIKHFANQLKEQQMTFIAVPTTSGTGSEVTGFAVVTDKEKAVKYPLVSPLLVPDAAILDKELVKTVPPSIVADTGMDVLTHALEAYVSTAATDFSDALAEKAAALVFRYLLRSYLNADDMEAKEKMHHASTLAGMAFNEASLGVNHALAHVIGGRLGVPHGRINSILLPHVVEYNADFGEYGQKEFTTAAQKYAYLAHLVGCGGSSIRVGVRNLIHEIEKLQKLMKMPQRLKDCQLNVALDGAVRQEIAQLALADNCLATNPRKTALEDTNRLLTKIL